MPGYSERYETAMRLASQAHATQLRKGTQIPYVTHVVHVAHILERHGFDEDIVLAGLLHDVVEDSDVELDVLRSQFGARVAELVGAVTENKLEAGGERPWEVRKREGLAKLHAASADVAALKAADALHNARTILADLHESGPAVWQRFKRGPEPSLWYYREIALAVRAKLGAHALADELTSAVAALAAAITPAGAQGEQGDLV